MDTTDDLNGLPVMVNPGLEDDPLNKQGQSGTISFAELDKDNIYISFGKQMGLYASDALLVFRKSDDIYRDLMAGSRGIDTNDLKDLYRIGMLLDSKLPKDQRAAMNMAIANPAIHERVFISLEEQLGPRLNQGINPDDDVSVSRGR